jgi:hypothetical protein
MLMRGFETIRSATAQEQSQLPVFSTWGYLIIQGKAQALVHRTA